MLELGQIFVHPFTTDASQNSNAVKVFPSVTLLLLTFCEDPIEIRPCVAFATK